MKRILLLFTIILVAACSQDETASKFEVSFKVNNQLYELENIYLQPYTNPLNQAGKLLQGGKGDKSLTFQILDHSESASAVQEFNLIEFGPMLGDFESFQDDGIVWNVAVNNKKRFKATFSGPVEAITTDRIINITNGVVDIIY